MHKHITQNLIYVSKHKCTHLNEWYVNELSDKGAKQKL